MARIGVLGGTFDPVHNGHLVAAAEARYQLALDRVLLVVANQPWQKVGARAVTAPADRLAMVEAAVEDVDGLEASAIEIERGGLTFTADTLATLADQHPGDQLVLIVGSDVAAELGTWVRTDEVRSRARLAVVTRPGITVPALPGWHVTEVAIPALHISSTDLRARVGAGRPLAGLVPPAVIRVIGERCLYPRP